jgi:hypothetical protein
LQAKVNWQDGHILLIEQRAQLAEQRLAEVVAAMERLLIAIRGPAPRTDDAIFAPWKRGYDDVLDISNAIQQAEAALAAAKEK